MNRTIRNCCLLLLMWAVTGQSQPSQFRYERQLIPGGTGPNRISPDVALLGGIASSDLRDLRFYESSGQEVSYLLIPPENPRPRWKMGNILPVAATKNTSGFEVDFGSASRIDRLLLQGIQAPFLKRFRLEGSGDRSHWTSLVAEGTLFDLPDEGLRMNEVGFTAGEFRYVRITWDDRESGVVSEPRSASARLVEQRAAPAPLHAPSVEFRKLSANPGYSRFQIRLPGPHLPIAAVELSVGEARLLRTARVTESKLIGGEVVPQTLGSSELRRVAQGNLIAADLRIPVRAPEGQEIEIVVEDGNNPPLNLTGVALEFSPQPWIYLESRTGASLDARYGNSHLEAPKYDLEAVRQYIGRADLKEAHWGPSRDSQPAEALTDAGIQPPPGASIDAKDFHYSRRIPDSPAGLTALLLDAGVLAHSRNDLSDLRITDAANHQIPYLLERRQETLVLDLSPLPERTAGSGKQSHYRLELPFENLPAAKLVLTTTERTFQRNISVEIKRASTDPRSDPTMESLASATWRHNDPETAAPPLTLSLRPSLGVTSATLVVDEGDNHPLAMGTPRLELPLYRLRFFYPGNGKLTLLYGNETLSSPRYDLELLAPRLVGVSSRELALDPENRAPTAPENKIPAKVFWAALIVAVLAVLALLVRLLRSENPAVGSGS